MYCSLKLLKFELWGSPLVQVKYQGEKACDKRRGGGDGDAFFRK
jgi:hypothetical protein